ncbi:MAG: hypothetical protein ABI355_06875 [Solirubrobacteraceae bacterium]
MAVGIIMAFKDATLAQYDEVTAKMGMTPGGAGGPGSLFHWVEKTDDGIRVINVWETKAQFAKFGDEQIGPLMQEVGFPAPPEVTFHEVHNYQTAG